MTTPHIGTGTTAAAEVGTPAIFQSLPVFSSSTFRGANWVPSTICVVAGRPRDLHASSLIPDPGLLVVHSLAYRQLRQIEGRRRPRGRLCKASQSAKDDRTQQ